MSLRFYFDSDVWLGLFKGEQYRKYYVPDLIDCIQKNNDKIFTSAVHEEEMRNKGFLTEFRKKEKNLQCQKVKLTRRDYEKARKVRFTIKKIIGISTSFCDCHHFQALRRVNAIPISYDEHWEILSNYYRLKFYNPPQAMIELY